MAMTRRLQLHTIQAAFGDCLLVEARSGSSTRYILIDGGPSGTYTAHLRPALARIAHDKGTIDLMVLSHIDNDHVTGLLDLLDEMRAPARSTTTADLPQIARLWHNSFSQAVGSAEIEPAVRQALASANQASIAMPAMATVMRGVGEGDALRAAALALSIPANEGFADNHVLVGAKPLALDDLVLQVVGPSAAILERLRTVWIKWLAHHKQRGVAGDGPLAIAADQSIPNLSSIVIIAMMDGRTLVLTGDARGDQILDGMREAGMLDAQGRRHVEVLKVPHHGSSRNANREFLTALTADTYVFSANGRYGNPDYQALVDVVEVAQDAGRTVELAMTNETPASKKLLKTHPPARFGYSARILAPTESVLTVDVLKPSRSPV
jgi:beta-lactamase superfamily II metal-dependent hydrolase